MWSFERDGKEAWPVSQFGNKSFATLEPLSCSRILSKRILLYNEYY